MARWALVLVVLTGCGGLTVEVPRVPAEDALAAPAAPEPEVPLLTGAERPAPEQDAAVDAPRLDAGAPEASPEASTPVVDACSETCRLYAANQGAAHACGVLPSSGCDCGACVAGTMCGENVLRPNVCGGACFEPRDSEGVRLCEMYKTNSNLHYVYAPSYACRTSAFRPWRVDYLGHVVVRARGVDGCVQLTGGYNEPVTCCTEE